MQVNEVLQPRGTWTAAQRAHYRWDTARAIAFFRRHGLNELSIFEIYRDTIRDPESPWIGDDVECTHTAYLKQKTRKALKQ